MQAIYWRETKIHSHIVGSFTVSGFPDWHCHEATGAGECTKGAQTAYFGVQNMYRRLR